MAGVLTFSEFMNKQQGVKLPDTVSTLVDESKLKKDGISQVDTPYIKEVEAPRQNKVYILRHPDLNEVGGLIYSVNGCGYQLNYDGVCKITNIDDKNEFIRQGFYLIGERDATM